LGISRFDRGKAKGETTISGLRQPEGIFGEPGRSIAADHLVTWNGGEPDLTLSAQLNALGVEHMIIGDAVRPRRFADATAEAKSSTDAWKPAIPANVGHAPH
jgi:hypothetical protein